MTLTNVYTYVHNNTSALANQPRIIALLAAARANLNQTDHLGATALSVAAEYAKLQALEALLRARADVDRRDVDGNTPLFIAAIRGHVDVVETLVSSFECMNE